MKTTEIYPLAVKELQTALLKFGVDPVIEKDKYSKNSYIVKFEYKCYSFGTTISWINESMNSTYHGSFRKEKSGEKDSWISVRNIIKNLKKM